MFTIYKYIYIYKRLYCLDKSIKNETIFKTCLPKFDWLPILIPKSVTESTDEMILELFFLSHICFLILPQIIIIGWNLSRFTIISFILNQSIADLLSVCNTFMSSSILFLAVYTVLPYAKLEN